MVQRQDGPHFVQFSNGWDHWKTKQIGGQNQTPLESKINAYHSNSERDQYSNPHCTQQEQEYKRKTQISTTERLGP